MGFGFRLGLKAAAAAAEVVRRRNKKRKGVIGDLWGFEGFIWDLANEIEIEESIWVSWR